MIKRVTQGLGALVTNSYLGYSRSSREDLGETAPIVETDRLRGSPLNVSSAALASGESPQVANQS